MNCNRSLTSTTDYRSIQPRPSIKRNQPDKTVNGEGIHIPRTDGRQSAADIVSLSDLTATRADVSPESPTKKARLEMNSLAAQSSSIAELTPNALTSCFQKLCNSDDGEELARLLSGTHETTRHNWFSSPLDFSEKNDTPLMYAARYGHAAVAATLIDYQANPCENNLLNICQSNALAIAAQLNQVKVIQVMAKSAEYHPDKPRGDGITPMAMAIQNGHTETTKILLEHNADPNYKIRYAIVDGESRATGSFGEQEPIPSTQIWFTPVMFAVRYGNLIILEQLLSKGGNPNNIDPANPLQESPLQQAIKYRQDSSVEMVELLLEHAADMHEKLVTPDAAISNKTSFYQQSLIYCRQFFRWPGYNSVNSGVDSQNSPYCLQSKSTKLRPTLFEVACICAEMGFRAESDRIAATFCDYYRRTPEGKQVEPSLLKWFYAGQFFLKGPILHSDFSDLIRKDSTLKLYFIRNVAKLHTLSSVFGQEDPSDFPRDKADRALDYDRKIQSELIKDMGQADTAMLQEVSVTALEKFNKYTMNFNDEAVINYLQKKMEREMQRERGEPTHSDGNISNVLFFGFLIAR